MPDYSREIVSDLTNVNDTTIGRNSLGRYVAEQREARKAEEREEAARRYAEAADAQKVTKACPSFDVKSWWAAQQKEQ